jgi:hypothetical protein
MLHRSIQIFTCSTRGDTMGDRCPYCGERKGYSHDCISYNKKRVYCENCGKYIGEYDIGHVCEYDTDY